MFIMFSIIFLFIWNPVVTASIDSMLTTVAVSSYKDKVASNSLSPVTTLDHSEERTAFSYYSENNVTAGTQVTTTDARIVAMRQFLIDYHSPMYPYADVFVTEADKYGLDWRLVASISGVESAFGNLVPYQSNNAWGWKGDPTRAWSHFETWKEGIITVTSRLAIGYGTDITPFSMESTYCPPCGLNPAHAWANGVNNFMIKLESYHRNLE